MGKVWQGESVIERRKDLAVRNQTSFSLECKRQVVEELLSGESRPAQLYRLYDVTASLLYHWKRQYSRGKFGNGPSEEGAVWDRVKKLERLVGKLTLENEVLKRGLRHSLSRPRRNGRRSGYGGVSVLASGGGARRRSFQQAASSIRPRTRARAEVEKEVDSRGKTEAIHE